MDGNPDDLRTRFGDWRARLRQRISEDCPPGPGHAAEVDRRVNAVLEMPVPTDAELVAMQRNGRLPSDDVLVRSMGGAISMAQRGNPW